jgi:isocitrate dehydrogenase
VTSPVRRAGAFALVGSLALVVPLASTLDEPAYATVAAIGPFMLVAAGALTVNPGGVCFELFARPGDRAASERNPIGLLLAGRLLFEYLGWQDAASVVRDAIAGTLADGLLPPGVRHGNARGTPVSVETFADAVVERLDPSAEEPGSGGVRSSAEERAAIKGAIASLHNALFEDELAPADVTLNQLLDEDEEADVSLPEVGINFYYWRRWSVERRLEVLLHELAHVDEDPGEPDHGDEFYERLVELTELAAEWQPELEAVLGDPLDFDRVVRLVVEPVHEETIEPDRDSVAERRRELRDGERRRRGGRRASSRSGRLATPWRPPGEVCRASYPVIGSPDP